MSTNSDFILKQVSGVDMSQYFPDTEAENEHPQEAAPENASPSKKKGKKEGKPQVKETPGESVPKAEKGGKEPFKPAGIRLSTYKKFQAVKMATMLTDGVSLSCSDIMEVGIKAILEDGTDELKIKFSTLYGSEL